MNILELKTVRNVMTNFKSYETRCPNCRVKYNLDHIDKHLDLTIDPKLDLVYLCEEKVNKLVSWLSK